MDEGSWWLQDHTQERRTREGRSESKMEFEVNSFPPSLLSF